MIEIERKFLVTSQDFKNEAFKTIRIEQGFLNTHKDRTVRVRLSGNQGFITVKGLSSDNGLSRFEWEKEISKEDAKALLKLCEPGRIEKTRYDVEFNQHVFEVDVFHGDNEGLIIAEVELKKVNEKFNKPHWIGEEVTGNIKYYNSQLSLKPFSTWHHL
ncbi:CYTH domain-containing protein [Gaetbulibacter aquiaggeris]|uniref:CYTH domain-containing protein n=1 Tax=Gaetbulibacter aquiaggeris TaxID=1735373 RepID=A0ABW7MKI0_9FLAO